MYVNHWSACCELASSCGRNFLWTQAGGGNVSYIDRNTLWIKRSGVRLRDMRASSDLVPLSVGAVRELFFSDAPDPDDRLGRRAPAGAGAPSVEAFFHALLGPWTAHAHLVSATALVSGVNEPAVPASLTRELGVFCAWVPYAPPGSLLASQVHAKLPAQVPATGVLLLRSHGAVVWGPGPAEVRALFDRLDEVCGELLSMPRPSGHGPLPLLAAKFDPAGTELFGPLWSGSGDAPALHGPWTPDAALHFGHGLAPVPGAAPALGKLFLRGEKLFYACAGPDILGNAAEIVSAQLTAFRVRGGDLSFLTSEQTDSLLRWGAGKYGTAAK
ncbi:MAG: hypothetical protein CVU65_05570 [Deltaproteobacteria bacterium HGW-Deltaproteobacteria-22]|jgi:ribulose-5-phosphate 4-epimerase/fuculose-1-phosphate aldolase|nr:MAG: hypothetical protein CVU65_05570 [Deltaproteobacteria bacterium HGW-Deltaproteobacteria-22]